MREYTFDKSKLSIKIDDIEFIVDTGHKDVSNALLHFSQALQGVKTATQAIELCTETINGILQDKKAVADIFAKRNITLDELIDFVEYLSNEIHAYKSEKLLKYITFDVVKDKDA